MFLTFERISKTQLKSKKTLTLAKGKYFCKVKDRVEVRGFGFNFLVDSGGFIRVQIIIVKLGFNRVQPEFLYNILLKFGLNFSKFSLIYLL